MGYGSSEVGGRIIPLPSNGEAAATVATLALDVVERDGEVNVPQNKASIGFCDAAIGAAASGNGGENISYNKYLQVCDLSLKSLMKYNG